MPRDISLSAMRAMYAQQTDEVPLELIQIIHADLPATIRAVNNTEEVVSGGETYSAFPFELDLPADKENEIPRLTLRIDNIDRAIVEAVRILTSSPVVELSIIFASSPNRIEAGPFEMTLKTADYDKFVVEGELSFEEFDDEPYPGVSFVPAWFPGMF